MRSGVRTWAASGNITIGGRRGKEGKKRKGKESDERGGRARYKRATLTSE
jgi:hypothetical protein